MTKIFEDAFMDIQSQMISLCLELVGNKVNKIYVYGSMEEKSIAFNAFIEVDGEAKTLNNVIPNEDAIWEFLDLGEADLEEIKDLCKKHGKVIPTELKMIYDCSTGKFDAKYRYETICSGKTGLDCSQIFMRWFNEVKKN